MENNNGDNIIPSEIFYVQRYFRTISETILKHKQTYEQSYKSTSMRPAILCVFTQELDRPLKLPVPLLHRIRPETSKWN